MRRETNELEAAEHERQTPRRTRARLRRRLRSLRDAARARDGDVGFPDIGRPATQASTGTKKPLETRVSRGFLFSACHDACLARELRRTSADAANGGGSRTDPCGRVRGCCSKGDTRSVAPPSRGCRPATGRTAGGAPRGASDVATTRDCCSTREAAMKDSTNASPGKPAVVRMHHVAFFVAARLRAKRWIARKRAPTVARRRVRSATSPQGSPRRPHPSWPTS
jgi:hypothetical protein